MVRGFWGDIIQSPYFPFGVELWKEPEKTMFKKQINFQQVYVSIQLKNSQNNFLILICSLVQSSADFAMFNVQNYITILEDLQEYNFPFTRIKQVERQLDAMAGDDGAAEEEEKKTEEINDDEEEKKEETKTEAEKMVEKLKKPGKSIDLESIDEGDVGESQQ